MQRLQQRHGLGSTTKNTRIVRDDPLTRMSDTTKALINDLWAIDNNHFDNNSTNRVMVADTQENPFLGRDPSR